MTYSVIKNPDAKSNWLRIVISVLASLFIVLHGRWFQIHEMVVSPSFYFALLTSAAMTYLLLYLVYIGDNFLNKHFPWYGGFMIRLVLQILVGLVLPALIDLLFAKMYLNTLGQDLVDSGFLDFDFPVIAFFLLVVNGYYYQQRPKGAITDRNQLPNDDCVSLTIKHNGTILNLNVNEDILCLIKEGKYITVLTMNGNEYQLNDTLNALQDRFQHTNLYRINRSAFINTETMHGYRIGDKPRTIEIILKPQFNDYIELSRRGYLVVTGDHVRTIREYFKAT